MKKTILVYGLLGGLLIALLKFVEYRFLIIEHSLEIYEGIVALLFAVLGIWLGLKPRRARPAKSSCAIIINPLYSLRRIPNRERRRTGLVERHGRGYLDFRRSQRCEPGVNQRRRASVHEPAPHAAEPVSHR